MNQVKANNTKPTTNEVMPCLRCTEFRVALYPGKYDGRELAGVNQYMKANTIKANPSSPAIVTNILLPIDCFDLYATNLLYQIQGLINKRPGTVSSRGALLLCSHGLEHRP